MTKGQTEQLEGHGAFFLTPAFSRIKDDITALGLCKAQELPFPLKIKGCKSCTDRESQALFRRETTCVQVIKQQCSKAKGR